MNISQWKIGDRTFFSLEVDDRLLLVGSQPIYSGHGVRNVRMVRKLIFKLKDFSVVCPLNRRMRRGAVTGFPKSVRKGQANILQLQPSLIKKRYANARLPDTGRPKNTIQIFTTKIMCMCSLAVFNISAWLMSNPDATRLEIDSNRYRYTIHSAYLPPNIIFCLLPLH